MSHVLNSSTSRSSDHGSLTIVTPGMATASPLPLTRNTNVWRAATRPRTGPSDFRYVAVVGVPIHPSTGRAPTGGAVRRGTKTEVSTHVGRTATAELYVR